MANQSMISTTQHHLETSIGNVDYLDTGTGTPTLYFHGTGAGNDAALLLEEPLIRSNCRLIIPNRPGYFGTTLGQQGSARFCATLAKKVLDHLAIDRVAVIGTSGGGMPAAYFAQCFPERTTALVLQCAQSHQWDSGMWLPKRLGWALFLFQHRIFAPLLKWENLRQAKVAQQSPLKCLTHMSGDRFSELRNNVDAIQQITEMTAMSLKCASTPAGIQNDWAILVGNNGITNDSITCPTLIIHDRSDPLVPFAHADWSHLNITGSRLLDIHAGGHLIWFGKDFPMIHEQRVEFIHHALEVG